MNKPFKVEGRNNNIVFECALEDKKLYNSQERTAFVLAKIVGLVPNQQNPKEMLIHFDSFVVCENCYEANKGEKGLHFEDPSNLVKPTDDLIQKLNLKKN